MFNCHPTSQFRSQSFQSHTNSLVEISIWFESYVESDTHSIFSSSLYLNTIVTARMQSRSWPPRVFSTRRLRLILKRRELRFRITCSKRPVSAYVILLDF